jgi:hypothetical protein
MSQKEGRKEGRNDWKAEEEEEECSGWISRKRRMLDASNITC